MTTFNDAAAFRMNWGKHTGWTLDEIATSDEGLLYLDFLRTLKLDMHTGNAVNAYLDDETIARDLSKIIAARSRT